MTLRGSFRKQHNLFVLEIHKRKQGGEWNTAQGTGSELQSFWSV